MTLQQQFQRGLEAKGEKRVGETFRYLKYSRAAGGFYYLGRAGSLRAGRNVQTSVPCSDGFKTHLRTEAALSRQGSKVARSTGLNLDDYTNEDQRYVLREA